MDWNQKKQEIRDMVDDELVERIKIGGIVGVMTQNVTREQARKLIPELSSDNPSRIWTRSQQCAIADEGTLSNEEKMQEAIDYYENILLPAALDALVDQQGQTLSSGKTCQWPPSHMATEWLAWCANNIFYTKKNIAERVYNMGKAGYSLWYIGEYSTGLFANAGIDPITGVQKKRLAVNTTYKNGLEVKHYYPEKNWY